MNFPAGYHNRSAGQIKDNLRQSHCDLAGNAPGLDAGATALIIMRRAKAEKLGIKPLATIFSVASGAGEPRRMAELPATVIGKALPRLAYH